MSQRLIADVSDQSRDGSSIKEELLISSEIKENITNRNALICCKNKKTLGDPRRFCRRIGTRMQPSIAPSAQNAEKVFTNEVRSVKVVFRHCPISLMVCGTIANQETESIFTFPWQPVNPNLPLITVMGSERFTLNF